MNTRITSILHWVSGRLARAATFLDELARPASPTGKFIDLAPTDEADKAGVYAEALNYATDNARVFNIALTGPYGSGKSSIIKSFLKRYQRPALNISLAAFVPGADVESKDIHRQEIERSILQQLLYGPDSNRLPLSRFKRIRSPGAWSIFKTFLIFVGIIATTYVFINREAIIEGSFFSLDSQSRWLNIGAIVSSCLFIWSMIHSFYVASLGLSLKSVSLRDIEIQPASNSAESILNRHLDEIVYFFQSTNYDLVVFEDLDRFNDADIFVTLREINGLINANADISRTIRFLYALRDDMFASSDRTKFFEFIVPVIPIINSSNSIDMVLSQGKRLSLIDRLDKQFIREVSRYLSDLRLITNIFNEYAIYVGNIESDNKNVLDANKLLAVLIYKNVYPRDFEDLHRGKGDLAKLFARHDEFVARSEASYKTDIAELEQALAAAEQQAPANVRELNHIYAMALIEALPDSVQMIKIDGQGWISPRTLPQQDPFEPWINASRLSCRIWQAHGSTYDQQVQVEDIEHKVDPGRSYSQRRAEILEKSIERRLETQRRVAEIRSEISKLRTRKFNEILRLDSKVAEDIFPVNGENVELARFLIMEGHLDDTYYHYTSLFHSGRLSPNDNKFLIQIRAFIAPDPLFQIDNPKEVAAAMRDPDFEQNYVLNVKLVDALLSDTDHYADKVEGLIRLISNEFAKCEEFLVVYYAHGNQSPELLARLTASWKGFIVAALSSSRSIAHAVRLLADLPEDALRTQGHGGRLGKFVAEHLPELLALAPELSPNRLALLRAEVRSLPAIGQHPLVAREMVEAGLFELTVENVEYVYQHVLGGSDVADLRTRNYTTLRSMGASVLERRIERDFEGYMSEVLLNLPSNTDENPAAILSILRREGVSDDILRCFLERQSALISEVSEVPDRLHAMLFEFRRVVPTWENCLSFLSGSGFDEQLMISYLDDGTARSALLESPIPTASDYGPLRRFLFCAAALTDSSYMDYVRALPGSFDKFPADIGESKRRIIINSRKINFSKEVFDSLADDIDLQYLLVATNVEIYLENPNIIALGDDFLEGLLYEEITDAQKASVVGLMNLDAIAELPERAALLGPIMDRTNSDLSMLNPVVAKSLIVHSRPLTTQISLLNKSQAALNENEARDVLAALPSPYSDIKTGYYSPRIDNTSENVKLLTWLDSRNIISSWKVEKGFLADHLRVNLYRR